MTSLLLLQILLIIGITLAKTPTDESSEISKKAYAARTKNGLVQYHPHPQQRQHYQAPRYRSPHQSHPPARRPNAARPGWVAQRKPVLPNREAARYHRQNPHVNRNQPYHRPYPAANHGPYRRGNAAAHTARTPYRRPHHQTTRSPFHGSSRPTTTTKMPDTLLKEMLLNFKKPSSFKRRVVHGVVTLVDEAGPQAPSSLHEKLTKLIAEEAPKSHSSLSSTTTVPEPVAPAVAPPAAVHTEHGAPAAVPPVELRQATNVQLPSNSQYRAEAPLSLLEKEEVLNNRIFNIFRELNITSFILKTEEFSVRALVSPVRTQFIPIQEQNVAAVHAFGVDRLSRNQNRRGAQRRNQQARLRLQRQRQFLFRQPRSYRYRQLPYEPLQGNEGQIQEGIDTSKYGLNDDSIRFSRYGLNNPSALSSRFQKKA